MIVEDDGIGFDVVAVRSSAPAERHLGLIGMYERVAHLGGTLTIESAPGEGTVVSAEVPLSAPSSSPAPSPSPEEPS